MEEVPQLRLNFAGRKCVTWKTRKNIEYLEHHLTEFHKIFHQNDCTVSGHIILVTDELENVCQEFFLQKYSFLKRKYF